MNERNILFVVLVSGIVIAMVAVYGVFTFYHRGELKAKVFNLERTTKQQAQDIQKLIDENNNLRKIVRFERTFLPYFSEGTKDRLLSVEGCLHLGG